MKHYDVIVIGTGPAGTTVGFGCARNGKKTAMVENRPFGGTCKLRGCSPKKVFANLAELSDWTHRHARYLDRAEEGLMLNWAEAMRFKREFTDPVPEKTEESMRDLGVDPYHGTASFKDESTIIVGDEELRADHIVIASGARPVTLSIEGEDLMTRSDAFLELDEMPARVAFVGAGYVSLELAVMAMRAGAEIVILEAEKRPLKAFEPELVDILMDRFRQQGAQFHTSAPARKIESNDGTFVVRADIDGHSREFQVDMVVHGAGRTPNLEDLNLDAGNVRAGKHGIEVQSNLRSVSNARVWAAGDCADSGLPLTSAAEEEGRVIARYICHNEGATPDHRGLATVVFTTPPLASVGLTEQQARDLHYDVRVKFEDAGYKGSVRKMGETHAGFKTIVDKETDLVLGAHLLLPKADETINVFALAVRNGVSASDLRSTPFAFPTFGYEIHGMV